MNGNYRTGDIVLGEWRLAKLLGQGSYGKVFEAEREDFGIVVKAAIKIITIPASQSEVQSARAEGMDDAGITAYFHGMVEEMVQEFAIMAKLKGNSNIVSYEDHRVMQHTEGIGWDILIRMELLQPMLDFMGSRLMEPREVAKVGVDMCRALELCERNDIIHRDIKPENIMVTPDGSIRLLDMDAARMVREKKSADTDLIGTVGYAAPEQYGFGTSDERTDIYSLGVVLCELVTGSLPKDRIPQGRLGKIIRKCTQIDPVNRYKNVQELQVALSVFDTGYRDDSVQSAWKKYAPPGFRSGKPANILISVFVYAALASLALGYTAEGLPPGPVTNVCRGIYLVMGLVILFFTANYLDVWKVFRIDRIRNMWLRTVAVLAVDGILCVLMILLMIFAAVSMGAYR